MVSVTLTTDWGTDGIYASAFKACVLRAVPGVQLIDVTHQIPPLDPFKAAHALKYTYHFFAPKTIHVISVGGDVGEKNTLNEREFICFEYNKQFFIGPNNGIWEMMFNEVPQDVYLLKKSNDQNQFFAFPELDVYMQAITAISLDKELQSIGEKVPCKLGRMVSLPVRHTDSIIGIIQYFDNYGNVITNISKEIFEECAKGREFRIMIGSQKTNYVTDYIAKDYSEGDSSKILALFSFNGFLEICIPDGMLSKHLSIAKQTNVLVQFYNEGEVRDELFTLI